MAKQNTPKAGGTQAQTKTAAQPKKAAQVKTAKTTSAKKSAPTKKLVASPATKKKVTATAKQKSAAKKPAAQIKKMAAPKTVAKQTTKAVAPRKESKAKYRPNPEKNMGPINLVGVPIMMAPGQQGMASIQTAMPVLEHRHDNTPALRYNDVDLAEFEVIIKKKLELANNEFNYLSGLLKRTDGNDTQDTEFSHNNLGENSAGERENIAQLASRQAQLINNLNAALIRITNKTYGICRATGKLIDRARLRAVPHATLSIEAKNRLPAKSREQNVVRSSAFPSHIIQVVH